MSQLLSFTGTCEARLDSGNSGNIIPLLSVPQIVSPYQELKDEYYLAVDFRLESLRGEISLLESFQQAPFPNFYPEDSAAKKLEKKFEIDQKYPSVEMEILKRSDAGNLIRLSGILLQNKGSVLHSELRLPYLGTGDVKLMGETDELFIRLNDKGYGVISSSNDYLQIEGDYSVTLTGVGKTSQSKIDLDLLWQKGILRTNGGYLESLPSSYPNLTAMKEAVKQNNFTALRFYQSKILSLHQLNQIAQQIKSLELTRCYNLKTSTLNQQILNFTSLQELKLDYVNRTGLDFGNIVTRLPIVSIYAGNCNLTATEIEIILVALVGTGRTNGILRIPNNNPNLSPNATAAKNALQGLGWSTYI